MCVWFYTSIRLSEDTANLNFYSLKSIKYLYIVLTSNTERRTAFTAFFTAFPAFLAFHTFWPIIPGTYTVYFIIIYIVPLTYELIGLRNYELIH